jgi:hypothetical protein
VHFLLKNNNKIGEKSEENRGWVVMTLGNEFPNMGIMAMQM